MIISRAEKSAGYFRDLLAGEGFPAAEYAPGGAAARQTLAARSFDLCVVDAPLTDEFGETLAIEIASGGGAQVILVVREESFEATRGRVEPSGVYTVAKPVGRGVLAGAIRMVTVAGGHIARLRSENRRLAQKIEDIRAVDRAKCLLIQRLSVTEHEAHRYIEKRAMDLRLSRRGVADSIIKMYDN